MGLRRLLVTTVFLATGDPLDRIRQRPSDQGRFHDSRLGRRSCRPRGSRSDHRSLSVLPARRTTRLAGGNAADPLPHDIGGNGAGVRLHAARVSQGWQLTDTGRPVAWAYSDPRGERVIIAQDHDGNEQHRPHSGRLAHRPEPEFHQRALGEPRRALVSIRAHAGLDQQRAKRQGRRPLRDRPGSPDDRQAAEGCHWNAVRAELVARRSPARRRRTLDPTGASHACT